MSTQAEFEIGSDFVGYRIEELIGRGGMGIVYRAYDLRLKRTVALKLVVPELALDERFRERFARETELAMSLEHPNVVPIHDAGDVDGRLYLAMRLVAGTDLRKLLRAEGPLEPSRALAICGQVGNALDAAHKNDLVHRDVKPSNVLVDEHAHAYLADFGLTRRLEEQGVKSGDGRSVGTPAYLAPEQIEGKQVDGRADVYALGCLLFECLTGTAPYLGGSRLAVAWAHLEEKPPAASRRHTPLPSAIDAVLGKAMAKHPEERYRTCAALVAAAGEALGLRRPPPFGRKRLALVGAVVVLVAAAAALAAAFATGDRPRAAPTGPVVHQNTVVRIDPQANAVSDVIDVGLHPMAVAVGGRSVWVYNQWDASLSEVDADTKTVRHLTVLSATPLDLGLLTGPVLAADTGGAWIIGGGRGRHPLLTRVPAGGGEKREYRLGLRPSAIAVGERAVWVVGQGRHDRQVLRIDPATGRVTATIRFPISSGISSVAVGLGAVWVTASSTGTLYRIDPRVAAVVERADLGQGAGRVSFVFGLIWLAVSDPAGATLVVDPRTLAVARRFECCPAGEGVDAAGAYGSYWLIDSATGAGQRWDAASYEPAGTFRLTDAPVPEVDGLCLTALAAGAGAVWVTVSSSITYDCRR
jgi:hypothetical protein